MTRQAVVLLRGTAEFPGRNLATILASYGRLRFHPGAAALAALDLGVARNLQSFEPGVSRLLPHQACAQPCNAQRQVHARPESSKRKTCGSHGAARADLRRRQTSQELQDG